MDTIDAPRVREFCHRHMVRAQIEAALKMRYLDYESAIAHLAAFWDLADMGVELGVLTVEDIDDAETQAERQVAHVISK